MIQGERRCAGANAQRDGFDIEGLRLATDAAGSCDKRTVAKRTAIDSCRTRRLDS